MQKLAIPHDALVFVGDGRKALFLRNEGDEVYPNLKTEQVMTDENPRTRDQGADRPGRTFKSADTNRRASVQETDWHELEEQQFAKNVAAALDDFVRSHDVKALVVAAPPATLAELRQAFKPDIKERILAEVDKDLTKHPVWQIEEHLFGRS
jgi:protein required for attachment to host cells